MIQLNLSNVLAATYNFLMRVKLHVEQLNPQIKNLAGSSATVCTLTLEVA